MMIFSCWSDPKKFMKCSINLKGIEFSSRSRTFLSAVLILTSLVLITAGCTTAAMSNNLGLPPAFPWWDKQWKYRVRTTLVSHSLVDGDFAASSPVDFSSLLTRIGISQFIFDEQSIRVVEYDITGEIIDEAVPFEFNNNLNKGTTVGTITIAVKGLTMPDVKRTYYIYFDSSENGKKPAQPSGLPAGIPVCNNEGIFNCDESRILFLASPEISGQNLAFPEFRAVFYGNADYRHIDDSEFESDINHIKSGGFNAVFLSVNSTFIETNRDSDSLNVLDKLINKLHADGIKVHLRYSIILNKNKDSSPELKNHPEWAVLNNKLEPLVDTVDLAIPQVYEYEKSAIFYLAERYHPDGIHLEEPYYRPYSSYTTDFRNLVQKQFGYDPLFPPKGANAFAAIQTVQEQIIENFLKDIRNYLTKNYPTMALSANGPSVVVKSRGYDLERWASQGYLDFYVPQIYDQDVFQYISKAEDMLTIVGPYLHLNVATFAMADDKSPLYSEIDLIKDTGAEGVGIFQYRGLTDENLVKIQAINLDYKTPNGYFIKGKVISSSTTPPYSVNLEDQVVETDLAGEYILYAMPGSYTVTVQKEKKELLKENIHIHGNTLLDLTVQD
jgi:uncharacterized lipoprotein YddW (UPF0748 family)